MSKKLSISDLCEITGKGDRFIRRKLKALAPAPGPKGAKLFESKEALQLIYGSDRSPREREALLLSRARRKQAELELNVLQGQFVSVEDVSKAYRQQCSIIKARMLAMPSAMAHVLSHKTDAAEIQRLLKDEVHDILTELSGPVTPEEIAYVEQKQSRRASETAGSSDFEN